MVTAVRTWWVHIYDLYWQPIIFLYKKLYLHYAHCLQLRPRDCHWPRHVKSEQIIWILWYRVGHKPDFKKNFYMCWHRQPFHISNCSVLDIESGRPTYSPYDSWEQGCFAITSKDDFVLSFCDLVMQINFFGVFL